jgi:diguanylate cyclase (GGDEF)-like protein
VTTPPSDARFDQLFNLTSIISLVFQIAATTLIAIFSYAVSRAVARRQMLYWAAGWACYALALTAIMFASRVGGAGPFVMFGYFFLEYAAVLLIFGGCRYTALDAPLPRWVWWLLAPAAILSIVLVREAASGFFWPFAVHTSVIGLAWAACLAGLWPALGRDDAGPGVRIVAVGLVLLSLDYLHHLPVGLYLAAHHITQSPYYYTIISLIDGMFEFVLGFGTVVVIVDKVRAELEAANAHLKLARDRTEEALHVDPLTEVSSRYSFAAAFDETKDRRTHRGCVVVIDLDGLKSVNDTHGHAAGDSALRAVAGGLRSLIRHEDRVYRWGGDEFVVVLAEIPIELARRRFAGLDAAVNRNLDRAYAQVGLLSVSWGVAEFGERVAIKEAIAAADAAMYEAKSRHRSTGASRAR